MAAPRIRPRPHFKRIGNRWRSSATTGVAEERHLSRPSATAGSRPSGPGTSLARRLRTGRRHHVSLRRTWYPSCGNASRAQLTVSSAAPSGSGFVAAQRALAAAARRHPCLVRGPGQGPARNNHDHSDQAQPASKRRRRNWSALRDDVVRLYGQGHTIRGIAMDLDMHQREVWRQLEAVGVARRARGTSGVVLSRPALQRLYIQEQLSVAEVARRFEVTHPGGRPEPAELRAAPAQPARTARPGHAAAPVRRRTARRAGGAARLRVSPDKVRADLARHGIPIRRPGRPAQTQTRRAFPCTGTVSNNR